MKRHSVNKSFPITTVFFCNCLCGRMFGAQGAW